MRPNAARCFSLYCYDRHRDLHSFPTRRSSDLLAGQPHPLPALVNELQRQDAHADQVGDRKSTRLNSSHLGTSYAVFCLKKNIDFHMADWPTAWCKGWLADFAHGRRKVGRAVLS